MIKDILNKMSLEEKVGQLCVPILQSDRITDEIREAIEKYKVGIIRYCPDAKLTIQALLSASRIVFHARRNSGISQQSAKAFRSSAHHLG